MNNKTVEAGVSQLRKKLQGVGKFGLHSNSERQGYILEIPTPVSV